MGRLNDDDYQLSMRISQRPRGGEREPLRDMLVHRLSDTLKLVFRRGLRSNEVSSFCESCDKWQPGAGDALPAEVRCEGCGRTFRLELAIYEEIH